MKLYYYDENPMTEEELADPELWGDIASYMDDEPRELLNGRLAPCTAMEFLEAYLKLDPEFAELLKTEFGIEVEGISDTDPDGETWVWDEK